MVSLFCAPIKSLERVTHELSAPSGIGGGVDPALGQIDTYLRGL